jgi:hypothetical protein
MKAALYPVGTECLHGHINNTEDDVLGKRFLDMPFGKTHVWENVYMKKGRSSFIRLPLYQYFICTLPTNKITASAVDFFIIANCAM